MSSTNEKTKKRKADHIRICSEEDVRATHNYWDDISLVHRALPEVDLAEIDTSVTLFSKTLKAPLIISGMTGGHRSTTAVNENLAAAAEHFRIGMGTGSQRAALEDKALESTYATINRHDIPLVFANIGAPQLIAQGKAGPITPEEAERAIRMIEADALAVHLNFLQEVVQPEGETNARGCLKAIEALCAGLPVIVKETGAGLSREMALKLIEAGVKGLDVGGAGGTSFAAVEVFRAREQADGAGERLGRTFWDWGIPAPAAVVECAGIPGRTVPVIATGGIRNGLDVVKALALGADAAGMAGALLGPALDSAEAVIEAIGTIIKEIRAAMFLIGAATIDEARGKEVVIQGATRAWLEKR